MQPTPTPMDVDTNHNREVEADVDELDDGTFEEENENEDPNVFKIRNPLVAPTANTFTTETLHTLIHEGLIDLNPPYQRDIVWPESKQIKLIDSIFRNFYIPPVVFAVHKDDDGEDVRICVDGKQRLTSIQKFFDGQIPLSRTLDRDITTKKAFWYTRSDAHKGTRLDIPDYAKRQFAEKQITCVEYNNLEAGTEREIFQRVQLGMTLTVAEKLQAISSPWAEWVCELEERHVNCEEGLAQLLEWDTKRGRDFQCLANFIYCCYGHPQQLMPTAQKLDSFLTRTDPPPAGFKGTINEVLTTFYYFARTPPFNKAFKSIDKRLAPVEFVFIGVLLYVMRDIPSRTTRSNAIYDMRIYVREKFRDIRTNTNVGKELWRFVEHAESNPGSTHLLEGLSAPVAPTKRGKKRKGDEEDGEYRPTPVKGFGSAPKTRGRRTN